MRIIFILYFAAMICTCAGADAEAPLNHFETYPLTFADLAAAEDLVRDILGPEGTLQVDWAGRRLLVLAPAEKQSLVAHALAQLDRPPSNVRIEVRSRGQMRDARTAAQVSGNVGVVVEPGLGKTTYHIEPRVESYSTQGAQTGLQVLTVASGRSAELFMGAEVPYWDWIMDYGLAQGVLPERLAWVRVGAYLLVEPQVIGEGPYIRVRLTPELSGFDGAQYQRRALARLATDVVVLNGQPLQLGGWAQDQEFFSKFLIGFDQGGSAQALDWELTARILPPPGPPGKRKR